MGDKKNNAGIIEAKLQRQKDEKDSRQSNKPIYFAFLF